MQLREFVADALANVSVESESRTIRAVALCGQESRNGYRYTESCLREAAKLYAGKPVFIDHDQTRHPVNRSARDLAGHVANPRFENDRLVGDVVVNTTESGNLLLALAQSSAPRVGMSHTVSASKSSGGDTVEAIHQVFSVDVVCNPATTSSFTEQKDEAPAMTLEQLKKDHPELCTAIETAAVDALRKQLAAEQKPAPQTPEKTAEQVRTEAVNAERKRQADIRALCESAGLADKADSYCSGALEVEAVRAELFEAMCKQRKSPASDDRDDVTKEAADPDAKFKKEFAEHRAQYLSSGISEAQYIHSRRVDEGLDVLQRPDQRPKEAAAK